MNHACEILLKLSLPHLRSQEFSLLLLVWGFMSMTYFALIFVCSMRYGPEFLVVVVFFFAYRYPVFPAPFIEMIVLSPLNCLCTLVENQLTIYGYF